MEGRHVGRRALCPQRGTRQNHKWHVGVGGKGAGDEEDVTEATTKDKMVKAEAAEVKEKKAAVR